jgi:methylated-DNA-[protein]-cysteine S-methyltransferase
LAAAAAFYSLMKMLYTTWRSPLGPLLLAGDELALRELHLPGRHRRALEWTPATAPFAPVVKQLEEYFAGERTAFELPLAVRGPAFHRAVWACLIRIPYGETRSYGQIARELGRPDRARAVGGANARNPLPIVVPCHRVIGSDGSLTGYGGGLEAKRALLALEQGGWQETLRSA